MVRLQFLIQLADNGQAGILEFDWKYYQYIAALRWLDYYTSNL